MEFEVVEKNGKKYYFQKDWGKTVKSWDEANNLSEKIIVDGKECVATLQSKEFWEEIGIDNFNKNIPDNNEHFWTTTPTRCWAWYGDYDNWGSIYCNNTFIRARLGFVTEEGKMKKEFTRTFSYEINENAFNLEEISKDIEKIFEEYEYQGIAAVAVADTLAYDYDYGEYDIQFSDSDTPEDIRGEAYKDYINLLAKFIEKNHLLDKYIN